MAIPLSTVVEDCEAENENGRRKLTFAAKEQCKKDTHTTGMSAVGYINMRVSNTP